MGDVLNDKVIAWAKGWIWPSVGLFPEHAGRGRRRVMYLNSEFNTLSIQTCLDVISMSLCVCITQCLERIHVYIEYILHFLSELYFSRENRDRPAIQEYL